MCSPVPELWLDNVSPSAGNVACRNPLPKSLAYLNAYRVMQLALP